MSRVKIIDIYNACHPLVGISTGILGDVFDDDFMQLYTENTKDLDEWLTERYYSFEVNNYFNRPKTAIISYQFFNFISVNRAKLTELYRLENIDDSKYSLYNNYDMTEHTTTTTKSDLGERTDISSVSPYDTGELSTAAANEMGSQHNEIEGEQDISRVGNIGIQTVSDMLGKHLDLFDRYTSFFEKMIDMFAGEYFYIGECDDN